MAEFMLFAKDLSAEKELKLPPMSRRLLQRLRMASTAQRRSESGLAGSPEMLVSFLLTDSGASMPQVLKAWRELVSAEILELSVPNRDEFFEKLTEAMLALTESELWP